MNVKAPKLRRVDISTTTDCRECGGERYIVESKDGEYVLVGDVWQYLREVIEVFQKTVFGK